MSKLYLITGFLGAGKTTFLQQFLQLFENQKVHIIINEFGKAGVDGALLKKQSILLDEINQGSIFCSCRLDRFETVLEKNLSQYPDVVLVETSGLSDPTNIGKILAAKRFEQIQYQGSVCLVDPLRIEKTIHTARMCKKQIAVSSLALINKCDMAQGQQIECVKRLLFEVNPQITVKTTQFGKFAPEWLQEICPLKATESETQPVDLTLQRAVLKLKTGIAEKALNSMLSLLADDTYRIKGFVTTEQGEYLVNCVSSDIRVEKTEQQAKQKNSLVLLAGKGMKLRARLKQAKEWYPDWIEEICYD